jgi:molybdopterin converting factor subunit 1
VNGASLGAMEAMRVDVRLFAILRERAGCERVSIELEPGATVADAIGALAEHAALTGILDRLPVTMAVNRDYASAETVLHSGDELALIPPVSGGAADVHSRVSAEPLSLERISALVVRPGAGAIVTFQGVTREVDRLEYEAYAEMAEDVMAQITADLEQRYDLWAVAIHHRVGRVEIGEASVAIAVSAPHREDALVACKDAIDTLKQTVPLWKKEVYEGGEEWLGRGS